MPHPGRSLRQRRAAAGRHDRRGEQRQHRHRVRGARCRPRASGAHLHAGLDEQGALAADRQLRRRDRAGVGGRGWVRRFGAARRALRARARGRVPAAAVREPGERACARQHDRAGDPAAARGVRAATERVRRRRRDRRHRHGRRARAALGVPEGACAPAGAGILADAAHRPPGRQAPHRRHQRRVRAGGRRPRLARSGGRRVGRRRHPDGAGPGQGARARGRHQLGRRLPRRHQLVEQLGDAGAVVTVFCDSNKKYLSTDLCREDPVRDDDLAPHLELVGFRAVR